jgi:ribosome assembly protein 1
LIDEAGPGCIVGIGGLEDILLKTGTICSDAHCPNFSKIEGISVGLVKVAIEPNLLSQMQPLKQGLTLMARADPSIEFHISKNGEFILSTCGEVHLEKCLKDLKDDYAPGIEFTISKPIIPFKETIINKSMRAKVFKVQVPWEELNSESETESDEEVKEGEQRELTLAQFIEKEREMELARDTLKKEVAMDMYIEKIFLM